MKPFIKWVGGKRSILDKIHEEMPEKYNGYYEPFIGGGSVLFSIQPKKAYIYDINKRLITTYTVIKNNPEQLIKFLKIHKKKHNKEYFLQMRQRLHLEKNKVKLASIFIYLNKTCYSGLYRVNKSNIFNVPMGNYKNPDILNEDNIKKVSSFLQKVIIKNQSFNKTPIRKGSFYYFDPPYHKTYGQYDKSGFTEDDQKELANFCTRIHKKGSYFMLSNSDTDFIKTIYKDFNILTVSARRSISCKSNQRKNVNELLIKNY